MGTLITFEGVDGVGKTSQMRRLAQRMAGIGIPVTLTREPGGSSYAELIRQVVLEPKTLPTSHARPEDFEIHYDLNEQQPLTKLLLMEAARTQHVHALNHHLSGRGIVLCDRYIDSTYVYQRALGDYDPLIGFIHSYSRPPLPTLTVLLDAPIGTIHRRIVQRAEGPSLQEIRTLRALYLEHQRAFSSRIRLVDADGSEEHVADNIWAEVQPLVHAFTRA